MAAARGLRSTPCSVTFSSASTSLTSESPSRQPSRRSRQGRVSSRQRPSRRPVPYHPAEIGTSPRRTQSARWLQLRRRSQEGTHRMPWRRSWIDTCRRCKSSTCSAHCSADACLGCKPADWSTAIGNSVQAGTPRTMTHKNAQETAHRHLATQQTAANLALPPSAYDAATLWRLVVAPARGTCLWWRERESGEMDGRE